MHEALKLTHRARENKGKGEDQWGGGDRGKEKRGGRGWGKRVEDRRERKKGEGRRGEGTGGEGRGYKGQFLVIYVGITMCSWSSLPLALFYS